MPKKISPEQKSALKEGLIVFAWAGISAILPMVIAYLENEPRWAALIPVINALAYMCKTAYQNRK